LIIATVRQYAASQVGIVRLLQWVAVPLYALVMVVAIMPSLVGSIGLAPIQVEAILLILLVLLGTQSAWLVTFARGDAG